jgi:hypothetical protein
MPSLACRARPQDAGGEHGPPAEEEAKAAPEGERMTTFHRMQEQILMRKLVAFAKRIACSRHGRDQEFNLYFEMLAPVSTVGRCYPLRDKETKRNDGHDILISPYYIRKYPADTNGFKAVFLHEMAHTNRHVRGHGLDFRRAARRLNVRTYWKMSDGNL